MSARFVIAMLLVPFAIAGCALSHEIGIDATTTDAFVPPDLLLRACPGPMFGPSRDCDWRITGTYPCPARGSLAVGCDAGCALGACMGNSMIRVCAGTGPCAASQAIGSNDDSMVCGGGVCSFVPQVSCPASGQITVMTAAFSSGTPYTCNVAVR